jgi:hypothetical protein
VSHTQVQFLHTQHQVSDKQLLDKLLHIPPELHTSQKAIHLEDTPLVDTQPEVIQLVDTLPVDTQLEDTQPEDTQEDNHMVRL